MNTPSSALLVSGLDLDYARRPFGHVCALATLAVTRPDTTSSVLRLAARCSHVDTSGRRGGAAASSSPARKAGGGDSKACGRPAMYSQRLLGGGSATIVVGGAELYRPACAAHHVCEPISEEAWNMRQAAPPHY